MKGAGPDGQDDAVRKRGAEDPDRSCTGLSRTAVAMVRSGDIAFDKRTHAFADILAEAGAQVTVVCGADTAGGAWRRYPERTEIRTVGPISPSVAQSRPIRVASNLVHIWALKRRLGRAVAAVSADVFVAANLDTLGTTLRAAGGRPVVYDSQEHFPSTGEITPVRRRIWVAAEARLIRRTARVITVSEPIAVDLARRYGVQPVVVYNGCSYCVSEAAPAHRPLRLIHQGKLFFDRHLDEIIEGIAPLKDRVHLTIQGWGEAEGSLRSQVRDSGLGDAVSFIQPCAPSEVSACAAEHDVGLISVKPTTDSLRWCAPNKLFDYLGGGLAVLSTDLPVIAGILAESGAGITYRPGDLESFRDALSALLDSPDTVTTMKRNAVGAASRYSWQAQSGLIVSVIRTAGEAWLKPGQADGR